MDFQKLLFIGKISTLDFINILANPYGNQALGIEPIMFS